MRRRDPRVPPAPETSPVLPRTPADVYLDAFLQAIAGVDLTRLTLDENGLAATAAAFRASEQRAASIARDAWEFSDCDARIIASECSAAAGAWLLGGDHDPGALRAAVRDAWRLARWTVRIHLDTAVVRGTRLPWRRTRPVLLVLLPATLIESAVEGLVPALQEYAAGRAFHRIIVDASRLRAMDAAGMGVFARIVRSAREMSGRPPVLRNVPEPIAAYLRGVHLLRVFDVEPPAGESRARPPRAGPVDEPFHPRQGQTTSARRRRKRYVQWGTVAITLLSAALTACLL